MREPLDVGARVHGGHPGCPTRRRHIDRHDPGVGERAAQERRVQDALGLEVGDIAAVADQQALVLDRVTLWPTRPLMFVLIVRSPS